MSDEFGMALHVVSAVAKVTLKEVSLLALRGFPVSYRFTSIPNSYSFT